MTLDFGKPDPARREEYLQEAIDAEVEPLRARVAALLGSIGRDPPRHRQLVPGRGVLLDFNPELEWFRFCIDLQLKTLEAYDLVEMLAHEIGLPHKAFPQDDVTAEQKAVYKQACDWVCTAIYDHFGVTREGE